jgi:hypothetical protein
VKVAALILGAFLTSGCSLLRALDFGGSDDRPFEFRFGWERGVETGKSKPGTVDDRGVYTPEAPEVEAILQFPDVHAGLMGEIRPEPRMTLTVAVEVFDVKVPWARWWSFHVGAGSQLVYAFFGKRLISVFEIHFGPWVGRDFEEHAWAWGIGGTLIRF